MSFCGDPWTDDDNDEPNKAADLYAAADTLAGEKAPKYRAGRKPFRAEIESWAGMKAAAGTKARKRVADE